MLGQIIAKTVTGNTERTAIVYGDRNISYGQLAQSVADLSYGLRKIGVNESSCIALVLPNCPEFVVSFYAVAQIRAIVLPLNPLLKEDELKYYLSDSKTSVIITDSKRAGVCRSAIAQVDREIRLVITDGYPEQDLSFEELAQGDREQEKSLDVAPYEGDFLYQYSSGSTGRPKRVCRTQKNLWAEASNFVETTHVSPKDRILCIVPLYHAHGLGNCLLASISTGARLVILEQSLKDGLPVEVPFIFRRPRILELIQQEQITIIPGVPYIFNALAETPLETDTDLSSVRLAFSAGNFLPKETFDKFLQRFELPIRQLYGCTEAGSVAINLEPGPSIRPDSVGLPLRNIEIKIVDEQEQELSTGLIGEILIKSPALTREYYNMPELNREAFRNDCFYTGDLGRKDEDGYLFITGRKKIFIDTGGRKVDPIEIEDVLMAHPKVQESVVVGAKRSDGQEIIKAVLVLKESCGEHEILSHCKERLAEFKVPKIVEFRDEIPKSPLGKILRKNLV
jgi:long-chain acyl-CoA synthetase